MFILPVLQVNCNERCRLIGLIHSFTSIFSHIEIIKKCSYLEDLKSSVMILMKLTLIAFGVWKGTLVNGLQYLGQRVSWNRYSKVLSHVGILL